MGSALRGALGAGTSHSDALCSALQEIRQRDEAECRAVEEAGKASDALYLPGMFAFSKGLPA